LLADREGWAVFIGTPKGHNFFYDLWKTANASESWFATSIKASTSGLIKAEELMDASLGMSEDQYEQEFECSFEAAILGAYYGKELKFAEHRITDVPYEPESPVYTAWDLGYHDDTAIWFYQVIMGEIHLIDYFSGSGLSVADYAKAVLEKPYKYEKHWLPHDARAKTLASNGKSIIEQLSEHLGANKLDIVPSLSVQDGIQAARAAFFRMWFDREKTGDAVELLKQYQREWDDDKKAFRDKPRHDSTSHCADAFRMMAVAWQGKTQKTEEKIAEFAISGDNSRITVKNPFLQLGKTRKERY
jgi:hypothetical protein